MKKLASLALLTFAGALLLNPPESTACGPFFEEAQFAWAHQPPVESYFAGQLGIVKPEYYRKYLVVAYRYFSAVPLTQAEIDDAYTPDPEPPEKAAKRWLDARNAVPKVKAITYIEPFRSFQRGNDFINFANCLPDAFDSAAATLAGRLKQWGPANAATLNWIAGQDAVFANCGDNPPLALPDAAPATADPLLQSDRQYQRAAALFYAMHYDEAESAFRDIGQPYLAARALLRKASVAGDAAALPQAEAALRSVAGDPREARLRDSARGLLQLIDCRLHPMERMTALAAALSKPDRTFARDLFDFTALWDRNSAGPVQSSDLADWVTTFQQRQWQHALDRWRARKSTAWLIAALASAGPKDTAAPDLITAAHGVKQQDPAYDSATYYGIRLSPPDAARAWATEALAHTRDTELANNLHAERLKLARNFSEFLTDAPRIPVAVSVDVADQDADKKDPEFDADAVTVFNNKTPLKEWLEAAASPLLPANLQTAVARCAWTRAILLNQPQAAAAIAKRAGYTEAGSTRFDAIFFMLRNPGVTPLLHAGYPRREGVDQLDAFRDNWWTLQPQDAATLTLAATTAANFLCNETLTWAKAHPEDPRVPEALHLAVRATRYGMSDKETTANSKACFQLLHSRYGTSKWAALTKYWY